MYSLLLYWGHGTGKMYGDDEGGSCRFQGCEGETNISCFSSRLSPHKATFKTAALVSALRLLHSNRGMNFSLISAQNLELAWSCHDPWSFCISFMLYFPFYFEDLFLVCSRLFYFLLVFRSVSDYLPFSDSVHLCPIFPSVFKSCNSLCLWSMSCLPLLRPGS